MWKLGGQAASRREACEWERGIPDPPSSLAGASLASLASLALQDQDGSD